MRTLAVPIREHPDKKLSPSLVTLRVLQRKCACGGTSLFTGECTACGQKRSNMHRHPGTTGTPALAPPLVHQVLASPGQSLDAATRRFMEPRFGRDFGEVKVHADQRAAESAQAVHALAYTVGNHLVFGMGEYAPGTRSGQRLLAHELTHVTQQRGASSSSELTVAASNSVQEAVAEKVSHDIGDSAAPVAKALPNVREASLQRQPAPEEETLDSGPVPIWHILTPPPAIQQHSLTCWAAALASWLQVTGADDKTFQEIIERYVGTSCIDTQNALPFNKAPEVFAEWGATFEKLTKPESLTFDRLKKMLQQHGHLLLAITGSSLGHTLVVYGVGIDDKGLPNPAFMSVMDPLLGKHQNLPIAGLSFPIEIGHLSARTRPAACKSAPGEVPRE